MIFFLQKSSHLKKINEFVFFNIFIFPTILSPILELPMNFKSNEIVTHGELFDALWAEVPAPASIKAAI